MRILYVTQNYPDARHPQAGIFIHRHALRLARRGFHVDVLQPLPYAPPFLAGRWGEMRDLPQKEERDHVRIFRVRYLRPPGRWFDDLEGMSQSRPALVLAGKLHRENPYDLIHSHWLATGGVVGRRLKEELGIPHVATARGGGLHRLDSRSLAFKYLMRRVLESCDRVFAVSESLADLLRRFISGKVPCSRLPNGCDLSVFYPSSPRTEGSTGIKILYAGWISREKGVLDLIEAYHEGVRLGLKARLELVGAGPGLPQAKRLALQGPGADGVVFTPLAEPASMPEKMRSADIFVCPSWSEGLSNAVVEALATGLPVIATDIPGMREVVRADRTGLLVPVRSPSQLARAILTLAEDGAQRLRLGRGAREHAERHFDVNRSVDTLIEIYRSLLREKKAAADKVYA